MIHNQNPHRLIKIELGINKRYHYIICILVDFLYLSNAGKSFMHNINLQSINPSRFSIIILVFEHV
jgi:hypothetical protein